MDYRDLQGLGTGGVLGMASILCTIHGFHPVHNPESNVDLFEDPTFLLQIGVESRVRLPACGGSMVVKLCSTGLERQNRCPKIDSYNISTVHSTILKQLWTREQSFKTSTKTEQLSCQSCDTC